MTAQEAFAALFKVVGADAATAEQLAAACAPAGIDDATFAEAAELMLAGLPMTDADRAAVEMILRDVRGGTVQ